MKIKLRPHLRTLRLDNRTIAVPRSVITQITKLREEVPIEDLISTVAKGDWAQSWARAFCLPVDRRYLPWADLNPTERVCIDNTSTRLAKRVARTIA